jgi:Mpv17 / PMP22 family
LIHLIDRCQDASSSLRRSSSSLHESERRRRGALDRSPPLSLNSATAERGPQPAQATIGGSILLCQRRTVIVTVRTCKYDKLRQKLEFVIGQDLSKEILWMTFRKLLQSGAQSGTIMAMADVGTQWMERNSSSSSKNKEYNWQRTLRWTAAGVFLHGPYFVTGFSFLDRRFGAATSIRTVATKTVAAQIVLFPPYLVALFGFMGVMEGHPHILEKIRHRVPEAFLSGCAFWPVANGINFTFVMPAMRVPYLAACAGIWNSYLSWSNAREEWKVRKRESLS